MARKLKIEVTVNVAGAELLAALATMEDRIMTKMDDLNQKLTALQGTQQQLVTGQTELIKDQDRVLVKLAELVQQADADTTEAEALITQLQDMNAQQLAAVEAADAALESAVPEDVPVDPNA